MKAAVDLHIHSALSPCADNDMTPNNIVGMAWLKELDIIAVTDHNTAGNCRAVLECAAQRGLIALPGIELETCEEVHLLCLFHNLADAESFSCLVQRSMPDIANREEIFGSQLYMDSEDNITGSCSRLLLTASAISLEEACRLVRAAGGAAIPAHIDRESYSILSNLGMIPQALYVPWLELSKNQDITLYKKNNPHMRGFDYIQSSDAHNLGDIFERRCFIELEEVSAECLIRLLRGG